MEHEDKVEQELIAHIKLWSEAEEREGDEIVEIAEADEAVLQQLRNQPR
jgi:hypothetical protein